MVPETATRRPARVLPAPIASFVGRDREVQTGITLLSQPEVRLLTLTGPGGIGKTRLSLQVASGLADQLEDGVFFVDLAAISEPTLMASAVAQVLDVRESRDESLDESLKRHLRDRQLLLVLDSFEHVLAAGSEVAELLTACPKLNVLVTSRTRLRLSGEHEIPVPPLALPDPDCPSDAEALGPAWTSWTPSPSARSSGGTRTPSPPTPTCTRRSATSKRPGRTSTAPSTTSRRPRSEPCSDASAPPSNGSPERSRAVLKRSRHRVRRPGGPGGDTRPAERRHGA